LLLTFFGVIPIQFQNAQYNIPVQLWVPLQYPAQGPTVFVTPTPEMFIKHGRYVDLTGRVMLPILSYWNHKQHNLLQLCFVLQTEFSNDPPVVSRLQDVHTPPPVPQRPNQTQPPPIPQKPPTQHSPTPTPYASMSLPRPATVQTMTGFAPTQSNQSIGQPISSFGIPIKQPVTTYPQSLPKPQLEPPKVDLAIEKSRKQRALLYHRLVERVEAFQRNAPKETDRLMTIAAQLNRNSAYLNDTKTNLEHIEVPIN
jgi:ESCRT-I complex subunit TSG101